MNTEEDDSESNNHDSAMDGEITEHESTTSVHQKNTIDEKTNFLIIIGSRGTGEVNVQMKSKLFKEGRR